MIFGKLLETVMKSSLDKNKKSKKIVALSSFARKPLTETIVTKFKDRYKNMRHIDISDDIKHCWFDKSELVAYLILNHEDDGKLWITALEVTPPYRGLHLGDQILDVAIKEGANALAVAKDNEVAIRMYKNKGFKTKMSKELEDEIKFGKRNNIFMYKE